MREDGHRDKEAWEATVEEKPAARVKRRRVSRHEDAAWGDPGKDCEIEAGAGGLVAEAELPEGPATGEGGLETRSAEANTETTKVSSVPRDSLSFASTLGMMDHGGKA